MKFRVIVVLLVLASVWSAQGEFELESLSEYQPAEVRRDKRTLTTICVEIKPSSPYEEPYFMCKGTEMPQFSKGPSGYSSKPSYKPKPSSSYEDSDSYHSGVNSDYHGPVKTDYHHEPSKYGKPTSYDSAPHYSESSKPTSDKKPAYSDHSTYSSYEAPKPTYSTKPYAVHHDSHDEYPKVPVHKPTYEKPTSHYEPTHSIKLQPYSHESQSYGHSQPSEYSKPSSYEHGSSYNAKPSYSEGSHSKPSYGHSGSSYTPSTNSKPNSYSAPASYEHSDHISPYHSKPSYSDSSSAKPYSKPTHDHPASYSKPAYAPSEYSKPVKPYAPPEKGYSKPPSYRTMGDDMMQPMWDVPSQGIPADGFGYRIPMEHYNFETPRMMEQEQPHYTSFDGPVKMELERDAPTLQAAYPYAPAVYGQDVHPTYPAAPAPAYPQSYAPPQIHGPGMQPIVHPTPMYNPSCPTSYLYSSWQPAIVSLPCYSQPGYGQPVYGQHLGAPPSSHLGAAHQFYPSNINPLQDHSSARSEGKLEQHKLIEDSSTSLESEEDDKKPSTASETSHAKPKKIEVPQKPELTEKKPAEKKTANLEISTDKPKEDQGTVAAAPKATKGTDTEQAYEAMMRMAKIAAQLNKDDSIQGGNPGSTVPGSDKSSKQFSRQQ